MMKRTRIIVGSMLIVFGIMLTVSAITIEEFNLRLLVIVGVIFIFVGIFIITSSKKYLGYAKDPPPQPPK